MLDENSTIKQFLEAAAARQPTPGGGSVAALAGALAATMGEMAANYSLGKKGLEAHAREFQQALSRLKTARNMLVAAMAEDQSAYENLSQLRKRVKAADGGESAEDLQRELAKAVGICVTVPQTISATAVEILEVCKSLVDCANKHLLSDLAVCADLAMATARCGLYNAKVNLPDITDAQARWQIETTNGRLFSRAMMLIQNISPRIWQRLESN